MYISTSSASDPPAKESGLFLISQDELLIRGTLGEKVEGLLCRLRGHLLFSTVAYVAEIEG